MTSHNTSSSRPRPSMHRGIRSFQSGVPALIPRSQVVQQVLDVLVPNLSTQDNSSSSSVLCLCPCGGGVCLTGPAGVGKSTIAWLVMENERVKQFFEDGIVWLDLGISPIETVTQLRACYLQIWRSLPSNSTRRMASSEEMSDLLEEHNHEDRESLRLAMSCLLFHRNFLLILDSVCHWQDAEWFRFGCHDQAGCPFRRLITTRLRSGVAQHHHLIEIPCLQETEACQLLRLGAARAKSPLEQEELPPPPSLEEGEATKKQDDEHARLIVQKCDCLPFLIHKVAWSVRSRDPSRRRRRMSTLANNWQATAVVPMWWFREDVAQLLDDSFSPLGDSDTQRGLLLVLHHMARVPSQSRLSFDILQRIVQHVSHSYNIVWNRDILVRHRSTAFFRIMNNNVSSVLVGEVLHELRLIDKIVVNQGGRRCFEYEISTALLRRYLELTPIRTLLHNRL